MRKMILFVCVLILAGCASKPIRVISEPKRIIHPELSAPVTPFNFDWKVIVIDDKTVVIGLDYDQSIDFKIFLEDIKRYIGETNVILCSYRKDLNEKRCAIPVDTIKVKP